MSAISVVVADQQRRLRSSYVRQLRPETGIAVIGEAATSYEVVKALKLKPLPAGVRLQIFYLREDSIAKRFEWTFVRKKSPKLAITCQKVGTARFAACP